MAGRRGLAADASRAVDLPAVSRLYLGRISASSHLGAGGARLLQRRLFRQRQRRSVNLELEPRDLLVEQCEVGGESLRLETTASIEGAAELLLVAQLVLELIDAHRKTLLQPVVLVLEQTHRALRVAHLPRCSRDAAEMQPRYSRDTHLLPEERGVLLGRLLRARLRRAHLELSVAAQLGERLARARRVLAQRLDPLGVAALLLERGVLQFEVVTRVPASL